jgi:hypothetical protein
MMPCTIVQNVVKGTCITDFASELQQKHWNNTAGREIAQVKKHVMSAAARAKISKSNKGAAGKV